MTDDSPYAGDWSYGLAAGLGGYVPIFPTFSIPADLSQPYTPPEGFQWLGAAPDPATYVTPRTASPPPPSPMPLPPPPTSSGEAQTGALSPSLPPVGAGVTLPPTPPPTPPPTLPPVEIPPTVPPSEVPAGQAAPAPLPGGPDTLGRGTRGMRPPPAGGGWSWEEYAARARRAMEDSIKRSRPRAGPGIKPPRMPSIGGVIIEGVIEPTPLGSGEPPLRGIRVPEIPPPAIAPNPPLPSMREPVPPELSRPAPPDVVEVSAPASAPPAPAPYTPPLPRSSATLPRRNLRNLLGALGALAPILRPIPRGQPAPSLSESFFSPTETSTPPAPIDPLTPPLPTVGTDPLTPINDAAAPLTQPFGPLQLLGPTQQTTEDRCNCRKRKHEPDPSDTIANVTPYRRRMSNWSLKNLNRGTKAAKLLSRFL